MGRSIFKKPIALSLLALLLLSCSTAAIAYLWYHSSSDLEAGIERGYALGYETDVRVLTGPPSSPERIEKMIELQRLFDDERPRFTESTFYENLDADYQLIGSYESESKWHYKGLNEVSPPIVDFHQSKRVAEFRNRVLSLLDEIGYDPICLGNRDRRWDMENGVYISVSDFALFMCEYVQFASQSIFNEELIRVLCYTRLCCEGSSINVLINRSVCGLVLATMCARLHDIDQSLINEMRYHLDQLEQSFPKTVHYDFIECLTEPATPENAFLVWYAPDDFFEDPVKALRFRLHRHEYYDNLYRLMAASRSGLSQTRAEMNKLASERRAGALRLDKDLVRVQHFDIYAESFIAISKMRLCLSLIEAEQKSEPWPIDPLCPSGRRLIPIQHKGKTVGAYSVGENGVDDGWEEEELQNVFWLYDNLTHNYD